jgi:hypothetical protein
VENFIWGDDNFANLNQNGSYLDAALYILPLAFLMPIHGDISTQWGSA